MILVVTDTGPLLHLHQVGADGLLAHLGSVRVTPMVWSELQRHAPSFHAGGLPSWLTLAHPSAAAMSQADQWVKAQVLHAGEAEALAYALEVKADLFLTDDTAARTVGSSLGVPVRGSLGAVLYAAATGHLDQKACLRVLDDLERNSTLWMSAKVKTGVKGETAGELPPSRLRRFLKAEEGLPQSERGARVPLKSVQVRPNPWR